MSELTLQLPEDVINRLQSEAERQHVPLNDLVRQAIESYLGGEPTKDELLEDLRQSMLDALAGRTRPADEVIEELRRKHQTDANAR
jgi:predicted transcriptional regulator